MRDVAVVFKDVWKSYPSYAHVTGGIKGFLFHLPQALKGLRGRRTALEGLSFEIRKGENFGFIGHNGAGKSTTLGLIAGVLSPDKGKVQVNGRVSPLLELGAGFHPELSGRANIVLNGVLLGLTREEVLEHEEKIIEFAGLGEFIDMPVRTYSSGMYAKLGFSVVANLKPEILLLDEVLAVGDITFQHKCKAVFEEFRKNPNVTMILVSHGLDSVVEVCDRVAWIEGKQVRMIGEAKEVVAAYRAANAHTAHIACGAQLEQNDIPVHIGVGCGELDCSHSPAAFLPRIVAGPPGARLHLSLVPKDSGTPLREWLVAPQSLYLSFADDGFSLHLQEGECPIVSTEPASRAERLTPESPLVLQMQAERDGVMLGAATWLPVSATAKAKEAWERAKQDLWGAATGKGFPPHLWPGGKTVRIVARNIVPHDAVGNFAVGIAATLRHYGIPTRLYAFASSPELAGIVSPIGDLAYQVEQEDVIFYHYSTEDEFLPEIARMVCACKILYYHNVTPGYWFREDLPEFADVLDRAREQFVHFSSFDAVAANSAFSVNDILPYIPDATPTMVYPPSMAPEKLAAVTPAPLILPRAAHTILWIGRMAPHKRPELALDIFVQLLRLQHDAAMIMVVSGRYDFSPVAARLEERLAALPPSVREKITLLERLSDAQLAYVYRNASVLLCTSGHEGYCLPVREALSFGLPVAALSQPAVEETLAGRGTILPEHAAEAADVLHNLLTKEPFPENSSYARSLSCTLKQRSLR